MAFFHLTLKMYYIILYHYIMCVCVFTLVPLMRRPIVLPVNPQIKKARDSLRCFLGTVRSYDRTEIALQLQRTPLTTANAWTQSSATTSTQAIRVSRYRAVLVKYLSKNKLQHHIQTMFCTKVGTTSACGIHQNPLCQKQRKLR